VPTEASDLFIVTVSVGTPVFPSSPSDLSAEVEEQNSLLEEETSTSL